MEDFKNDWEAVASTPAERFITPRAFEVLERAGSWDLPEKYALVVRVQHPHTYKVTEKCFKRVISATRYCNNKKAEGYLVTSYDDQRLYSSVGFQCSDNDDE